MEPTASPSNPEAGQAAVRELVSLIVGALVNHPDDVRVEAEETAEKIIVRVQVVASDAGIVIGRRGHVVKAIRQIAGIIGYRLDKKVFVDVVAV